MAAAQTAVAYPASLDREPLLAWLQRETDIAPERVVAVTPQALISIVSTFPAGPGSEPRVVLRAEALSAETVTRSGAVSWHVSMSADCKGRRVRLGETTGYPERNLLGDRTLLRPPEAEWRKPDAGAALEAALRAVCEPDFKGPFQAPAMKVAQPDAPAAAPPKRTSSTAAPTRTTPPPPELVFPPSAVAPKPDGRIVVQIGASTSEADVRALIAGLGSSLGGRKAWIETAQVKGTTWRRAVVGGFANGADAARFCADLKAAGRGCFVRVGRAG
jgi:hypothetical protein